MGNAIVKSCRKGKFDLTIDNCIIGFGSFSSNSSTSLSRRSVNGIVAYNTADTNTSVRPTLAFSPPLEVINFGNITRGEFEGDADIAGTGVFAAFMTLSVIVTAAGLIVAVLRALSILWSRCGPARNDPAEDPPPKGLLAALRRIVCSCPKLAKAESFLEKVHLHLDDLVLASADTQLLLILAFGMSFHQASKCRISLYHYFVAHHIVLLGLLTSIQAFAIIRSPLKFLITSIARIGVMLTCIIQLLITKSFTASLNPFVNVTNFQIKKLSNQGIERGSVVQNYILTVMIAVLILVLFYTFCYKYCSRTRAARKEPTGWDFWLKTILKCAVWITCLVLTILNWVITVRLRNWMNQNEWLERNPSNPERGITGVGQWAPLTALGVVLVTLFNALSGRLLRSWKWLYNEEDDHEGEDNGKLLAWDSIELESPNEHDPRLPRHRTC